ncbi:hypothetical protein J6590_003163 [Homalodisca vitripennis]|nr:hypothetical protein J6590_003163 [Homalodisca vitripennis]
MYTLNNDVSIRSVAFAVVSCEGHMGCDAVSIASHADPELIAARSPRERQGHDPRSDLDSEPKTVNYHQLSQWSHCDPKNASNTPL